MKLIVGLVLIVYSLNLNAQLDSLQMPNNDSTQISFLSTSGTGESFSPGYGGYDKIHLESGDSVIVNIIGETKTEVAFKYPLNTMINKLNYARVKEIHYKDGRVRQLKNSAPATGVGAEPDNVWRLVVITEDESDVSGLKEIGPVTAKAEAKNLKTSIELLEKNARINLQKKSSQNECNQSAC